MSPSAQVEMDRRLFRKQIQRVEEEIEEVGCEKTVNFPPHMHLATVDREGT